MNRKPEKPHKLKADGKHKMLKKIIMESRTKKHSSSSKEEGKVSEEKGDASEISPEKKEENAETPARVPSPEPNCAICLEPLQNKSFTDSCFHTFCFTCLLEWSKVKAECPLCKQQFKSIVHNVQKDLSYDEYHINSRSTSNLWSLFSSGPDQRFRYPTTMTTSRIMERNLSSYPDTYRSQIASHRMRYAPHSVRLYNNSQIVARRPCDFRRRVYEQNLWVTPLDDMRVRDVGPDHYRRNPACTHRLLPWLNRELVTLLQNNETQITFVLELIMALITRHDIRSQEFFIHIEPYMGERTQHFIHELYRFATAPFEMESYDRHAIYDYGVPEIAQTPSSPDSDVVPIDLEEPALPLLHRPVYEKKRGKRLKKLVLKKNGENSWESSVAPSLPRIDGIFSNPGPSTSTYESPNSVVMVDGEPIHFTSLDELESADEGECQIVTVVKPRHERTPEIIDLSSDEEKPQTVIEVSSGEEDVSPDTRMSEMEPGEIMEMDISQTPSPPPELEVVDLDSACEENTSSSQEIPKADESSAVSQEEEEVRKKEERPEADTEEVNNLEKDIESEMKAAKVPSLASAIVRPWAMNSEASGSSSSVTSKRRRHTSYYADSSTENYSENEITGGRSVEGKKLKLRSVVAHFSFDHSDSRHDSIHRSSHKRHHKDKKKRKKYRKHYHRFIKRRILSDSESS